MSEANRITADALKQLGTQAAADNHGDLARDLLLWSQSLARGGDPAVLHEYLSKAANVSTNHYARDLYEKARDEVCSRIEALKQDHAEQLARRQRRRLH